MADLYDPGKIAAVFANIIITDFADGTFVAVSRTSETFTKLAGADGRVVRVRSRDKTATVTFTLLSTSPVNALLAAVAKADELTGVGTGSLTIKDALGTTLITGDQAWIEKYPDIEYAKDHSPREWVIGVANLEYVSI